MPGRETAEISCRIVTKPALHFIEARLPADYVARINDHIDRVRGMAEDYSPELVGQVSRDRRSAQLKLNLDDEVPAALAQVLAQIGAQLLEHQGISARVIANDMWTVHSYAGDYNPLHDHGANTLAGLSSILYLKVPSAIAEKTDLEGGAGPDLTKASGACDGFTHLVWGTNGVTDLTLLRPSSQHYVKPETGKLLVFPNWLLHGVNPFFGEGERRTLSCNMDIFDAVRP